jgi:hypothetical protein
VLASKYSNLKLGQRPLYEGDQEVVKSSGRNEPLWVAIQKCRGATLGISLYNYLYLKPAKMLCLSYCLLCFLVKKIGEQEGRTGFAWKWGVRVEKEGRGQGREVAQIIYTYMNKCKNNKNIFKKNCYLFFSGMCQKQGNVSGLK